MTGKMKFHFNLPLEREGGKKEESWDLVRGREGSIMLQKEKGNSYR